MKTLLVGSVGLLWLCLGPDVPAQVTSISISQPPGFIDPNAGPRSPLIGPPIQRESRVLSHGPLAPAREDRDTYREFLRDKHSGLMRLMPKAKYESSASRQTTIKVRGGGAYYSFAYLSHEYGYGSDISLEQNILSVGFAGADYGILQNLGDVPLTDITLADSRTSVLANYQVPKTEFQVRSAYAQLGQGVVINGELYSSRLPLVVNNTYLLRSIVIRRTDLLVAFRVIRQDADGSATILWKLLKKYS